MYGEILHHMPRSQASDAKVVDGFNPSSHLALLLREGSPPWIFDHHLTSKAKAISLGDRHVESTFLL